MKSLVKLIKKKKGISALIACAISVLSVVTIGCSSGHFKFGGVGFPFIEWDYSDGKMDAPSEDPLFTSGS